MADVNGTALRDLLAGLALVGLMVKSDGHSPAAATTLAASGGTLHLSDDQLAERAYKLADAMLRAGGHKPP